MLQIEEVDADRLRMATSGGLPLPLEQSPAWTAFAESQGAPLWKHLVWTEDGKDVAVAAFYRAKLRGMKYLHARGGPHWLKEVTPERETELRGTLASYLKSQRERFVFVRMHATYSSSDLEEPFSVICYDRTVIIDGGGGDAETALSALPKTGRRLVKRAQKKMAQMGGQIVEETGLTRDEFQEHYALLTETAKRDGFRPHPFEHYWQFLNELGPEHGRLYCARIDGELAAWDLVGVGASKGNAFYGASSELSRTAQAVPALDFEVARRLGEEGKMGLDLMGIHSPSTPDLFRVGKYKMQFADRYIDVPPVRDFPLQKATYRGARAAFSARGALRKVKSKIRKA